MCGRFWQGGELAGLQQSLHLESLQKPPVKSFNLAPSQNASVIVNLDGLKVIEMRFGLVPSWADDLKIGNRMINARAETIFQKVSFRKLILTQRCLIPCNGFYEWKQDKGYKRPFLIRLKTHEVFNLAGIWSLWVSHKGDKTYSFAIITTEANTLMSKIHHRMPVILTEEKMEIWLDPKNQDKELLLSLLKQYDSRKMEAYEVSTFVNIPGHDSEECIRPVNKG